jgi:transcriptional regulator with XRE-family HTH domain
VSTITTLLWSQYHKPLWVYGIDIRLNVCEIIHMRPRPRTKPESINALRQFYKDVGLRVRDARKKASNMTQKALATNVGLTRTSLTNIENGRQKLLLHTFAEIATALGVEAANLLPKSANSPQGLPVNLPSSLDADARGFIERAIGTGVTYEKTTTTIHRNGSHRPSSRKRNTPGSR